jgi:hypothetical protein
VSLFQKDSETGILSDSPTRLLGCPDEASGLRGHRFGELAHLHTPKNKTPGRCQPGA